MQMTVAGAARGTGGPTDETTAASRPVAGRSADDRPRRVHASRSGSRHYRNVAEDAPTLFDPDAAELAVCDPGCQLLPAADGTSPAGSARATWEPADRTGTPAGRQQRPDRRGAQTGDSSRGAHRLAIVDAGEVAALGSPRAPSLHGDGSAPALSGGEQRRGWPRSPDKDHPMPARAEQRGGGCDEAVAGRPGPARHLVGWAEAAEILGVTPRLVRHLWFTRQLPGVKIGRCVRFDPEGLWAYVEANRVSALRGPLGV